MALEHAQLVLFAGVGRIIITTGACPVQLIQQSSATPWRLSTGPPSGDYRPEFVTPAG